MAINENTKRAARHIGYIAASGGGKSQALGQNSVVKKCKGLMLLWDTNKDHKSVRYTDRAEFAKAVRAAVMNRKRRSSAVRLSYTTSVSVFDRKAFYEEFEWFCELVWTVLDGKYETFVILEELGACSQSSGAAAPALGLIMTQGRKYGAVVHYTTQRPSMISKDVYTQTDYYFVGKLKVGDRKRMINECGFDSSVRIPMNDLEFIVTDTITEPEHIKLTWKVIK